MIRAVQGKLLRCYGISVRPCNLLVRLTAVTAAAAAVLLCSCGDSGGGSSSPAALRYVYVASLEAVTLYSVDQTTGGLATALGSPVTDATGFSWVNGVLGIEGTATDPSGRFLYVFEANSNFSGVHIYSIGPSTGTLTEVPGSPFDAYGALAFDASGTHAYFASGPIGGPLHPATISAYSIESSGALTPLATYTFPITLSYFGSIVSVGNHLYAVAPESNSIIAFTIAASGELSENVPGSPFATDTRPYSIVADPSGAVLYTANSGNPTATNPAPGSISAFTIDPSTGALTPAPKTALPIAASGAIAIDPMGRFLFVPVQDPAEPFGGAVGVSVYAIDTASAALSLVPGSPFPAGRYPGVAITGPTDRVVYVLDQGAAQITELSLASNGALTPLPGSPVAVGGIPDCMAFVSP